MKLASSIVLALLCLDASAQELADPLLARSRAHYEAVGRELLARPPQGLTPAQLAARLDVIARLDAYRRRGEFTRNTDFPGARMPYFVDREGRLCPVATLLHETGEDDLVRSVAAANNHVWVSELAGDARFADWLARVGLGFDEAVRIQEPGGPIEEPLPANTSPWEGPGSASGPAGSPDGGPSARRPVTGSTVPGGSQPTMPTAPFTPTRLPESTDDDWIAWWEANKYRWLEGEPHARVEDGSDDLTGPETARQVLRRRVAPRLRAELVHPQLDVRAAAAFAYARAAQGAAVADLAGLLEDPSQAVRESAILALGLTDSEAGVHALLTLLRAAEPPTPLARPLALVALGEARRSGRGAGTAAILARLLDGLVREGGDDALHGALLHQAIAPTEALATRVRCASGRFREECEDERAGPPSRGRALEVLRFDPDSSGVLPRLLDAAHGRNLDERRSAACALAEVPGALEALLTAAELEAESSVRGQLLLAIGEQGGSQAREFLSERLVHGRSNEFAWAALALGLLAGDENDVEDDVEARWALRAAHAEANQAEREVLMLAFGLARDAEARDLLVETLSESRSDRLRMFAALGLGLCRDESAHDLLVQALTVMTCPYARSGLALALALQDEPEDLPRLVRLLCEERRPESLRDIALALGLRGGSKAVTALLPVLEQDVPMSVRAAVLDALGLALADEPTLALTRMSTGSNPTVWPSWVRDLAQRPF